MPVPETGSPTKIPAALPMGVRSVTWLLAVEVVASCEVASGALMTAEVTPAVVFAERVTVAPETPVIGVGGNSRAAHRLSDVEARGARQGQDIGPAGVRGGDR